MLRRLFFDAFTQLVRIVQREDCTVIVSPDRGLAHDRQPAGVGVGRFADQIVDDAGAVVLGRVDVIDSRGAVSTPMADARSGGGPKARGPASCIAPYPDRLTSIWPSPNVDIMSASRLESGATGLAKRSH
jgi:hypothetical protein